MTNGYRPKKLVEKNMIIYAPPIGLNDTREILLEFNGEPLKNGTSTTAKLIKKVYFVD